MECRGEIDRIDHPTAFLFRVALNAFRLRRRRATMAVRNLMLITRASGRLPGCGDAPDVRSDFTRVMTGGISPSWSPDGSQIAYEILCGEGPDASDPWHPGVDNGI